MDPHCSAYCEESGWKRGEEVRREQHSEGKNTVVGKETRAEVESKGEERSGGKDVGRLE